MLPPRWAVDLDTASLAVADAETIERRDTREAEADEAKVGAAVARVDIADADDATTAIPPTRLDDGSDAAVANRARLMALE